jgi:hypothetical protein
VQKQVLDGKSDVMQGLVPLQNLYAPWALVIRIPDRVRFAHMPRRRMTSRSQTLAAKPNRLLGLALHSLY